MPNVRALAATARKLAIVVAGGVFGGQQAVAVAARAGQVLDVAAIVAPESVDANGHLLTGSHPRQLSLLEVGSDPDVVRLHNHHQGLTGLDPLTDFDRFPPDDPGRGRIDLGVTEIQKRLVECRLRGLRVGPARGDGSERRSRGFAIGINLGVVDPGRREVLVIFLL